jgi:hypothetical protein
MSCQFLHCQGEVTENRNVEDISQHVLSVFTLSALLLCTFTIFENISHHVLSVFTLLALSGIITLYFHHLLNVFLGVTDHQNVEDMDSYVGFLAALRCSYYKFVKELSKQCKQIVRHHLDSVTSPYSHICYDNDFLSGVGSVANSMSRFNHFTGVTSFDLADSGSALEEAQENLPPRDQQHMTPPNKGNESKEVLRESQLTVPETPSPDLPSDIHGGKKKDNGIPNDGGPRKRQARMAACTNRNHHNSMIGADDMGLKSGSSYSTICAISAQYFAKMREVLIERNVPSALNSGFLTPWYVQTDIYAILVTLSALFS